MAVGRDPRGIPDRKVAQRRAAESAQRSRAGATILGLLAFVSALAQSQVGMLLCAAGAVVLGIRASLLRSFAQE